MTTHDNRPDYKTISVGVMLLAAIFVCVIAAGWLTGCKDAADAGAVLVEAREAGAPFDAEMERCKLDALSLDAGGLAICESYNACQKAVARKYGVPDTFGHCVDAGGSK